MARAAFETLEVYQLSEKVADEIWNIAIKWNPFARDTVGKQIVRSADSIGANIAEGFGRGTVPDNKRFVRTARGSLNETIHFLRRAFRRGLVTQRDVRKLKPFVDELGPRLNSYLNAIGTKKSYSTRVVTTNNKPHTTNK